MSEDDESVFIRRVELPHHFATATAGWEDGAVLVDGDNERNFRLVGFEHFGDGGMLRAEAEAASEVEADACVGFARTRDDHRRHAAGATEVARFDWARELMRLSDDRRVVVSRRS